MARIFISNREGTGGTIVTPLDPPYEVDPDGNDITEALTLDPLRPVGVVGAYFAQTIDARGPGDKFLVLAYEMNAAPASGAYDIGDPFNDADMDASLSQPERSQAESLFDQPNNSFRNWNGGGDNISWRELIHWSVQYGSFAAEFGGEVIKLWEDHWSVRPNPGRVD